MYEATLISMPTEAETGQAATPEVSLDVPADGEFGILMQSLEDDIKSQEDSQEWTGQIQLPEAAPSLKSKLSNIDDEGESLYGQPLSVEEAAEKMPPEGGGLIYTATLIPDEVLDDRRLAKAVGKGILNSEKTAIKPRRPSLAVRSSNFFKSLTKVGPRYIFSGILNGWPGLTCLEVLDLERKGKIVGVWHKVWSAKDEGAKGIPLRNPEGKTIHRVILRCAPWSNQGWSKESPGFAFWYEAQKLEGPEISYGTDMLKTVEDSTCTHIHMVSHRYAVKRENPRDLLTYHSICLLEWDHGKYTTVAETAYLNGIGGFKGKSNFYADKDQPVTKLYERMPAEMILPWRTNLAEIRCYDVQAKNLDEFRAYLKQYEGNHQRFIDPRVSFSHPARLTFRSKSHIAQYLLNYITRDASYADLRRNCQTFAADFCSFIAGKKDIVPFHPVVRMDYQPRTYFFLYDSHMYIKKDNKKKGKK